ncbi:unnamed protein product [Caenorhabditis brenneri]
MIVVRTAKECKFSINYPIYLPLHYTKLVNVFDGRFFLYSKSNRTIENAEENSITISNGYFYGSPKKNAGYGGHHAPYFNKGNRPTTSNNPTFNNRSNWNKTYSNNQATSFGHENGWNGRSHGYHGGASVTHTFRNRSMTGMEFVHGRGNVQSMNFTVFQHMSSNSSEQQATSSGFSNVYQQGQVLNGDNYEHGRNQTRLTVSQLFGRSEETEVPIDQLRPPQDDLEGLTEQFDQLVHQQSAGRSTTPQFDHSDPRVGASSGTFEDDGQETHIGMGTPLMRLSAFEKEMIKRNSAASSPDGNSIQSRKSSPVTADNDVKSDVGVSSSGHTLQPSKQVAADAPSTSGQAGKRRRRRNRSKKSSKTNKSFDADVTIGNRYDGLYARYLMPKLDSPLLDINVIKKQPDMYSSKGSISLNSLNIEHGDSL